MELQSMAVEMPGPINLDYAVGSEVVPEAAGSEEVESEDSESEDSIPADFAAAALERLVAPARDRRTILLSELSAIREKIQGIEKQHFDLQVEREKKEGQINALESFIQECVSLGQSSRVIEAYIHIQPYRSHNHSNHNGNKPHQRSARDLGPDDFSARDCLAIFEANPSNSLSNKEVVAFAPAAKRASARQLVGRRVNYLQSMGKLRALGAGVYRLAESINTTPLPAPTPEPARMVVVAPAPKPAAPVPDGADLAPKRPVGRPRKVLEIPPLPLKMGKRKAR